MSESAAITEAYVWIKLATAQPNQFAILSVKLREMVGSVAARACKEFPRWGLDADQIRIHLVAESGNEPDEEAINAARATKHLPVDSVLTPGAWLVAVSTTAPGGGSGGGSVGVGA